MKIIIIFLFIIALIPSLGAEDPWGKDSDLAYFKFKSVSPSCCEKPPTPILGAISDIVISFHQNVISPADGPRSHFLPSSSQYTREAIRRYGFFQGFYLGCDRLMRENSDPWVYIKVQNEAGKTLKWNPVK
jgi:putative component of membrane protein insertase Oxa1/YidC/SpoIIIJ protein YidD